MIKPSGSIRGPRCIAMRTAKCKWLSHKSITCNVSHYMMTCCEIATRKYDINKKKKRKRKKKKEPILKMVRWGKEAREIRE
jgi:hypothetical protein